ncbi:MAG: lipid A biosynthesis acyltransferase [Gammaproteobacteria bacterium]|nr:lipid A biosynthesis acyltransferase [Gammaproteobacteria bacterium]
MSREWFSQSERGSMFWMLVIRWIALHLGRSVARFLLYPITLYFFISSGRGRRASSQFLSRVFDRKVTIRDRFLHFHTFAATILDRLFLLAGREALLDIRIHNAEVLLEKVDAGEGAILLGSHLGSFEVLRALAVQRQHFPLRVLMYADHNQMATLLLNELSPEVARTVIPLGRSDTLLKVKEALDQGSLVGMLGDRMAESDKQVVCQFLGEKAHFPAGPMLLAVTLKVPVILFYGLYRGGNRYDIYFEKLTDAPQTDRAGRQAMIDDLTCSYAQRLEHHARQAPYNWFNFYDYWHQS